MFARDRVSLSCFWHTAGELFFCFFFPAPNQYKLPYMEVSCGMEPRPTQLGDVSRVLFYLLSKADC